MIGRSRADRNKAVGAINQTTLLAEENGWRFHQEGTDEEPNLFVERVDETGYRTGKEALIPYRKAEIHQVGSFELYVVTGEYWGRRPCAVVKVSAATTERVASHLRCAADSRICGQRIVRMSRIARNAGNWRPEVQ